MNGLASAWLLVGCIAVFGLMLFCYSHHRTVKQSESIFGRARALTVDGMEVRLETFTEVLLLRHAEKPDRSESGPGLTAEGQEDSKSLTIRGWQRAGGLAALLGGNSLAEPRLHRPDRIYASAFRPGGAHSRRPEQTVQPVAQRLGCTVDLSWALHQEAAFGAALAADTGTALVCWQHQGLAALARGVVAPQLLAELPADWSWPDDCYDVIWSLRRGGIGQTWQLVQYCQSLLSGDLDRPFRFPSDRRG